MTQVADKVLAWLYDVLQEYQDPQRTYSDAARTLSGFSNLSPRTEVYTHESGASALLLTLSGTLPIDFRGTIYRIPIKTWIPQTYPRNAPIVYVIPGKDMLIRPGQHVGVDGRVYHPYLRDWNNMWDRASITECLEHLQDVFAKEPPVISKAHQQQYHQRSVTYQHDAAGHDSVPPQLPPKQRLGNGSPVEMPAMGRPTPPPRPPKSENQQQYRVSSPPSDLPEAGPPLPPLPPEANRAQQHTTSSHIVNGLPLCSQYSIEKKGTVMPPVPSQYPRGGPPQQYLQRAPQSPVSPISPVARMSEQSQPRYSQVPPSPYPIPSVQGQFYSSQPLSSLHSTSQRQHHLGQSQAAAQHLTSNQYGGASSYQPVMKPNVPRDLLSDPFDITIPSRSISGSGSAPPIPPNPEKEHLLHALSTSLVSQAQDRVAQDFSRLAPLQAQEQALHAARARLDSEIQQLEHLTKTLDSNEAILHHSVQECDMTIKSAKSKPQPPIDEVLMAPTLVAQQLWTLSAEEAGCHEAMYILQKALDQGRISGEVFVRQMRSLGRERFLKMVLVRKCAKGLGLKMHNK